MKLDIRVVPDSMKSFPHPPRDTAFEIPKNFESRFDKASCKNHSSVKLTWEENDPKRYKFLTKRLTDTKLDEIDYKDYIASESESDENENDEEELEEM